MADSRLWHLVARKLSGEATLDELRELEQILHDNPELSYKVDTYTNYFEHPQGNADRSPAAKQAAWSNHLGRLQQEFPEINRGTSGSRSKGSRKKVFAFAAFFLLLATAVYVLRLQRNSNSIAHETAFNREVNTMPGTRSKTVLPDGTIVWLNSDSRISYNADFGKTKRELTLTGEAFFDVAHNPAIPMVVHAKDVNVWVKGTAFNVRSYPDSRNVETSLIRGLVELTTIDDPERKIILKPNEKITIEQNTTKQSPGEKDNSATESEKRNVYHIDQLKESMLANVIPEISWVENKLVFDNEPFSDIVRKMEKWYNIEIVLENKGIGQKSFSGVFGKENIWQALEALQMINHFEFEEKGGKIFIK